MKPERAIIGWKYETESERSFRLVGDVRVNYTQDVSGVFDGIQNLAKLIGIPYDRQAETVNIILVPEFSDRSRMVRQWLETSFKCQIDMGGGANSTVQTLIVHRAATGSFKPGDNALWDQEYVRIAAVDEQYPDANHDRLTVVRGVHGSEAAAHVNGSWLNLKLYSVEMVAVTLSATLGELSPPSNLLAFPYVHSIRLVWTDNIAQADRPHLDTYVVFWSEDPIAAFDPNDEIPAGVFAVDAGPNTTHVDYPLAGDPPEPDTTNARYYRVAARDVTGQYSAVSNEATATALGIEGDPTGGDTEVPDPDDPAFVWDADFMATADGGVWVLVAAQATENGNSADLLEFIIREYEGPAVNFDAEAEIPFTGSVWVSAVQQAQHPGTATFGPLVYSTRYELSIRVRNAFGWSHWMTPAELAIDAPEAFENPSAQAPTGLPYLETFGAWTKDNPPPFASPGLGPGMVRFTYRFGQNSATSFYLHVIGYTGSFPAETLRLSHAAATATATRGTLEVTVSGYSATANQFAGKLFRIGRNEGLRDFTQPIQEFGIVSNTAGNPFTITLRDHGWKITSHGQLTYFEIVDAPLREVASWARAYKIDTPAGPGGTYPVDTEESFDQPLAHMVTMKYAARLENFLGRGAWRHSDNTRLGTDIQANAIAKTVSQVAKTDQEKSARNVTITGLAATNVTDNDIDIGAGVVWYDANTSESVSARSFSGLGYNKTIWLYKLVGLTTIYDTESAYEAEGETKVALGVIVTPTDSTGRISFMPFHNSSSLVIAADRVIARYLSAIVADLGLVTAGTLRGATIETAASGARIELTSVDGLRAIDSLNNPRVQIPTTGVSIDLTVSDTIPGYINFGSLASIYATATQTEGNGFRILPTQDETAVFSLGNASYAWKSFSAYSWYVNFWTYSTGTSDKTHFSLTGTSMSVIQYTGIFPNWSMVLDSAGLTVAKIIAGSTKFNNVNYTWPASAAANKFLKHTSSGALEWADAAGGGSVVTYSGLTTGYVPVASDNAGLVTNSILYQTGSQVGVGLTTLGGNLDVKGAATSGTVALSLRSGDAVTPNGSWQILFGHNNNLNYRHGIRSRHNSGAQAGNSIDFYLWAHGGAVTDLPTLHGLTVQAAGVGIGITDPATKLEVSGNVRIRSGNYAFQSNGDAGSLRGLSLLTAGVARWFVAADTTAEGGSDAGSDFRIYSYADGGGLLSTALFIRRSNGRVGFGNNTNPAYTVDVTGILNATTIREGGTLLADAYSVINHEHPTLKTGYIQDATGGDGYIDFRDPLRAASGYTPSIGTSSQPFGDLYAAKSQLTTANVTLQGQYSSTRFGQTQNWADISNANTLNLAQYSTSYWSKVQCTGFSNASNIDIYAYTTSRIVRLLVQSGSTAADSYIYLDLSSYWISLNYNGDLTLRCSKLGFFSTNPITKPTVTGSRGGNAALASLCTALANLGLITDSTT